MKKTLCFVFIVLALAGCTDPSTATRVLNEAGYTGVQITGYRWFRCGDDYTFQTGFTAFGPTKQAVSGTVCSGWLKGNSIKID